MTPDQAKGMAEFFISVIEMETPTTRKIIAAVPEDKADYRPHEDSMTAMELARHIPGSDIWFHPRIGIQYSASLKGIQHSLPLNQIG